MSNLDRPDRKARYREIKDKLDLSIAVFKRSWRTTAKLLIEMHSDQLWREGGYSSFDDFLKVEYGWSRRRGQQIMQAKRIEDALPESAQHVAQPPKNPRQLAEMASVHPNDAEEVLREAAKDGPVTARTLRAAVQKVEAQDNGAPPVLRCKTGAVIPPEIQDNWRRAEEFSECLRKLNEVRLFLEPILCQDATPDVVYSELTQLVVSELRNVYTTLKRVIPYAVCPTCSGHKPARCSMCKGRGWLSKFLWDSIVPKEVRDMRLSRREA